MNKKLIAIAVAGMALPMAVQAAEVKLTGRVQAAYTDISVDNSTKDTTTIEDDFGQSRFGFKASADAGGGMKVIARSEWKYDPTDVEGQPGKGTAEWQTRDQYVGLKGGFGTVLLGTQTSPYKVAGGVKIDPWTATAIEGRSKGVAMNTKGGLARANLTGLAQSGHVPNAISYTSPKLGGGVSIAAAYVVNGGDTAPVTQSQERDGSYSVAVNYKTKGLWVFAATSSDQCADLTATVCTDASISKIGAQWKSGAHTVAGQYEVADKFMTTATNNGDGDYMFLNYQFKMGKNILTASYGTFDGDNAADLDVDYMAVGVIHKFTKKTRAFVGYRASDEDGVGTADNSETALSAGMRFDF